MLKSLKIISLFVFSSVSFNLNAQDGHIDVFHGVMVHQVQLKLLCKWRYWYIRLEDGKTYLMLDHIPVKSGENTWDLDQQMVHPATITILQM